MRIAGTGEGNGASTSNGFLIQSRRFSRRHHFISPDVIRGGITLYLLSRFIATKRRSMTVRNLYYNFTLFSSLLGIKRDNNVTFFASEDACGGCEKR